MIGIALIVAMAFAFLVFMSALPPNVRATKAAEKALVSMRAQGGVCQLRTKRRACYYSAEIPGVSIFALVEIVKSESLLEYFDHVEIELDSSTSRELLVLKRKRE